MLSPLVATLMILSAFGVGSPEYASQDGCYGFPCESCQEASPPQFTAGQECDNCYGAENQNVGAGDDCGGFCAQGSFCCAQHWYGCNCDPDAPTCDYLGNCEEGETLYGNGYSCSCPTSVGEDGYATCSIVDNCPVHHENGTCNFEGGEGEYCDELPIPGLTPRDRLAQFEQICV